MRTISQVAELTGISIRTLQYYDEIGLLKPSELTQSGYRLYDDEALQKLQQILFFRELDFKLKDIREIIEKPDFDRIAAFKKQKELLLLKRNRTDRLIQLLSRLEKGDESEVAKLAIKQFGSIEKYTEAMKHNLEHFSDIMENWYAQIPEEMRAEDRFLELARHKGENVATDNVQNLVKDIIAHAYGNSSTAQLIGTEDSYCKMII